MTLALASDGSAAAATVAGYDINISNVVIKNATDQVVTSNYTITPVKGTLTVNSRPITITANNQGKTYGETFTFANTEYATSDGTLAAGQSMTLALASDGSAAAATVAGYDINISNVVIKNATDQVVTSNYTITPVKGTLTVNSRPITITANNQGKTYGETFTFANTEYATSDGTLAAGQSMTLALASDGSAAAATVAGYDINISNVVIKNATDQVVTSNYTITPVKGTLTVNSRPITITANNQGKTYGETFTFANTEYATSDGTLAAGQSMTLALASDGSAAAATVAGYDINISNVVIKNATDQVVTSNYTITPVKGTLTVNSRPITITANNQGKTYGETFTFANTEYATSDGTLAAGQSMTLALASDGSAAAATVAGYDINISNVVIKNATDQVVTSNYTITPVKGTLTVNSRPITITANNQGKTYGETFTFANTEYATSDGTLAAGQSMTLALASDGSAAAATVAGYDINISNVVIKNATDQVVTSNYTITPVKGTLTVNSRPITITANNQGKTYGETFTFANTEYATSDGTLAAGQSMTLALASDGSAAAATVAGYDINISNVVIKNATDQVVTSNYTITPVKGTLTVNSRPITITANNQGKTYGETFTFANTEYATSDGTLAAGQSMTLALASDGSAAAATVAGYDINISNVVIKNATDQVVTSNYTITPVKGTLTVNSRPITITANNQGKTYGETFTFANTEYATSDGTLAAGQSMTLALASDGSAAAATVAGYDINISNVVIKNATDQVVTSNYTITPVKGTLTVNSRPITITANNQGKTYGETFTFANTEYATSDGTLAAGQSMTLALASDGSAAAATVAGYDINISNVVIKNATDQVVTSNYTITPVKGTLTVNSRPITITANNQGKTYGETFTFANTEYATSDGTLAAGQSMTLALASDGSAAAATVAGYDINISNVVIKNATDQVVTSNYTITPVKGTLTVNSRPITITANNQGKTYGETFTFANTEYATSDGTLAAGQSMTLALASDGSAAAATVAGYDINISNVVIKNATDQVVTSNYTITPVKGTLTVNSRPITITANNQGKTYGETFTFANTEYATSDGTLAAGQSMTLALASDGSAAAATVAGYDINISNVVIKNATDQVVTSNYTITPVKGTLTVNSRPITITANNQGKTYGETFTFANTEYATSDGTLAAGQSMTLALASDGSAAAATVAGYDINISNVVIKNATDQVVTSNYTITPVKGTLTVNSRPITITANNQGKTYGETFTFANTEYATSDGTLAAGQSMTLALASDGSAAAATVAGYDINISNVVIKNATDQVVTSNYTITPVKGTLTVNSRPITITANNQGKTYGETFTFANTEYATSDGTLAAGQSMTLALASDGSAAAATVAGYDINISNVVIKNATDQVVTSNYTITPVKGTLTVNSRPITITANNQGKTYGETFTFANTEYATSDGTLAAGQSMTLALASDGSAAAATVAGYDINISNVVIKNATDQVVTSNYTITPVKGTLTVNSRPITITANNQGKTYGETFTFANTEYATSDGTLAAGQSMTLALASDGSAAAATVAGYDINISNVVIKNATDQVVTSNYTITPVKGTLTVNSRPITITANNQGKTYGETFTFANTEYATSDGTLAAGQSMTLALASDGSAAAATVAGYDINISNVVIKNATDQVVTSNYTITPVKGTLTVNSRPITITANNQGKTYGETFTFANTEYATSDGTLAAGQSMTLALASDGSAAAATVAGYDINISNVVIKNATDQVVTSNYTITPVKGTLTVNSRPITITANNQGKTYGETFTFANTEYATSDGTLAAGQSMTLALASDGSAAAATVAGYDINISNVVIKNATDQVVTSNYTITPVKGTLTVNSRQSQSRLTTREKPTAKLSLLPIQSMQPVTELWLLANQ